MKRKKLLQRELDFYITISILTNEYDIDYFYKKNFEIRTIVVESYMQNFLKKNVIVLILELVRIYGIE